MLTNLPLICIDIIADHLYKLNDLDWNRARDAASLMMVGNDYCQDIAKTLFAKIDNDCIREIDTLKDTINNVDNLLNEKKPKNEDLKNICRNFQIKVSGNKEALVARIDGHLKLVKDNLKKKSFCPLSFQRRYAITQEKNQYERKRRKLLLETNIKNIKEMINYSYNFKDMYESFLNTGDISKKTSIENYADRYDTLKSLLEENGCVLRNDSVLCKRYIDNIFKSSYDVHEIVDTMVEMKFFYEHTSYKRILDNLYGNLYNYEDSEDEHYYYRRVDKVDLSKRAKDAALKLWLKNTDKSSGKYKLLPRSLQNISDAGNSKNSKIPSQLGKGCAILGVYTGHAPLPNESIRLK